MQNYLLSVTVYQLKHLHNCIFEIWGTFIGIIDFWLAKQTAQIFSQPKAIFVFSTDCVKCNYAITVKLLLPVVTTVKNWKVNGHQLSKACT